MRWVCTSDRRLVISNNRKQPIISRRLQEERGSDTSNSEAGDGLAGSGDGDGVGGRGSLDLAVGDLSDLGAASGRGSLDLAIRDLGDGSTGGRGSLDLAVGDLGDGGTAGGRGGLDLTVGDLRDGGTSGDLDLAIRDLGHGRQVGRSLDLAVGDLGNGGAGGLVARGAVSLNLSIANLAHGDGDSGGLDLGLAVGESGDDGGHSHAGGDGGLHGAATVVLLAAAGHGDNLDGLALLGPRAVVQVVEVTRAALVEDGGGTDGQGAVLASGETSSVDGTSLGGRAVELELVVGDNGANAALAVGQDTILEVKDERLVARARTLLQRR